MARVASSSPTGPLTVFKDAPCALPLASLYAVQGNCHCGGTLDHHSTGSLSIHRRMGRLLYSITRLIFRIWTWTQTCGMMRKEVTSAATKNRNKQDRPYIPIRESTSVSYRSMSPFGDRSMTTILSFCSFPAVSTRNRNPDTKRENTRKPRLTA
ncbi:hypothetical protein ACRALDRAFT_211804 [Sodiomyces alcalophilus JCM 7366]|uniref:uncharacterized protein n=1 Tax=Sodiomyces alcalophilus JCM 7366 TaxID=591952 RepID=UPI0039B56F65